MKGNKKTARMILLPAMAGWLCLTGACPAARGSGRVISQVRAIESCTGVLLTGQGKLIIALDGRIELRIEAEDNLLPLVESRVSEGILIIGLKPGTLVVPTQPILYQLTIPSLGYIGLSGSGDIEAPVLEAPIFQVYLSGSGNIRLAGVEAGEISLSGSGSGGISAAALKAGKTSVVLGGSGGLEIGRWQSDSSVVMLAGSGSLAAAEGSFKEQKLVITGSGSYRAGNVACDSLHVIINGSGSAEVLANARLKAEVTGSGSVRYRGSPAVEKSIHGTGRLESAGD